MKLIIGNKNYSSWSLRPWLLLKHFQIPFEEILIKLDLPETTAQIKQYCPTGKVPALIHDDFVVWDSMAIMEYLHELYPEKNCYPLNPQKRARARSLGSEMHSGFAALREALSFNVKKRLTDFDLSSAEADIARLKDMWAEELSLSGGPYLFGDFSIADAMFAPIAFRFRSYGVETEGEVQAYCETLLNHPAMKEWNEGAEKEDFVAIHHK